MTFFRDCKSKSGARASAASKAKEPKDQKEVDAKKIGSEVHYHDVIKIQPEPPQLNKEKQLSLDGVVTDPEALISAKRWKKERKISDPSVIATVFPSGIDGTVKKKDVVKDSKGSEKCFVCLESANLPFKFTADDSDDDDTDWVESCASESCERGNLAGYMRGVAISLFYNQEFDLASEYLKREFNTHGVEPRIDEALADLECDIYRNEFIHIEENSAKFDAGISKAVKDDNISICDLLRWIEELRTSNRHFGAILLARAVILSFPSANEDNREWYLNLSYYIFVEMCLRTACIYGMDYKYSDTTKLILISMEKAIGKMKTYLFDRAVISNEAGNIRRKIAICYIALSFYCNCFRLFKSAEKCTRNGFQIVHKDYQVKIDLFVNDAASSIGQDIFDRAKQTLQKAKSMLGNMTVRDMRDSVKRWRMKRIKKMIEVCWVLGEVQRLRFEFENYESD